MTLTIVMYHYVRDVAGTRFPGIKALNVRGFEEQLDYLMRAYIPCDSAAVIAAVRGDAVLPDNACLLTFDDGLVDHYTTVFPRLEERGITAVFAPNGLAIERGRVLDVHKVHLVLSSCRDHRELGARVSEELKRSRERWTLPSDEELRQRYFAPGRFDPPEIAFLKRLLQRGLPGPVRHAIVDVLFRRFVSDDEPAVSAELYMTTEQLRELDGAGMEIANHAYSHAWLDSLPLTEQAREIDAGLDFLRGIRRKGAGDWVMCFPHGGYTPDTLRLVADRECAYGLTARVDIVAGFTQPLELPRFDTNDVPPRGAHPRLPAVVVREVVAR